MNAGLRENQRTIWLAVTLVLVLVDEPGKTDDSDSDMVSTPVRVEIQESLLERAGALRQGLKDSSEELEPWDYLQLDMALAEQGMTPVFGGSGDAKSYFAFSMMHNEAGHGIERNEVDSTTYVRTSV
ncbi:hypothetical protein EG329_004036 [Mollisiaceae sp. DMI_Dod_QoI]|nr:hypothetical protein EG329_004036 [Helotiales sp. DMI_Dod_QoI]